MTVPRPPEGTAWAVDAAWLDSYAAAIRAEAVHAIPALGPGGGSAVHSLGPTCPCRPSQYVDIERPTRIVWAHRNAVGFGAPNVGFGVPTVKENAT